MLTVNKLIPRGRGVAGALARRAATVELDWDVRQKSRFDATDSQGRALGVFLPRGTVVRGGDLLVAEDGSLVRVVAAPQPVLWSLTAPTTDRRTTCCARPTISATAMCSSNCAPTDCCSSPTMCWPTCCGRCT